MATAAVLTRWTDAIRRSAALRLGRRGSRAEDRYALSNARSPRARELLAASQSKLSAQADRSFGALLLVEGFASVGLAIWDTPANAGGRLPPAFAALATVAAIGLPALALISRRAGDRITRHTVAVAQIVLVTILMHLAGRRGFMHLHVLGSLAVLAAYRDPGVLLSASAVALVESITPVAWLFGAPPWGLGTWSAHAVWIALFDLFLIHAIRQARQDAASTANHQAELEETNLSVEWTIEQRTRELDEANHQLDLRAAELRDTQEKLLRADRLSALGRLSAGVAHEINNPLAYVMSNIEFVQAALRAGPAEALEDLDELVAALGEARQGAGRVKRIVADLKVFARGQSEKAERIDVREALDSAINMAGNELRHRARVIRDYGEVPAVEGDASRLGQVFLNLVINAIQALPPRPIEQNELRVGMERVGEQVRIRVRDNGSGMPPEVQRRIFDPFFTTKPVGVGTGLGLSICHGIVTAMGGDIRVESQPGEGTCFTIDLPIAKGEAEVEPKVSPLRPATPGRARILVVDDEPNVCRAIERALGREHRVVAFTGARAALNRVREGERFDLLLCDLMMPELSGMQFFDELATAAPQLRGRLVFLSGGVFTPEGEAFARALPAPLLTKPFDLDRLCALAAAAASHPGPELYQVVDCA